jgi:hypothetical protein
MQRSDRPGPAGGPRHRPVEERPPGKRELLADAISVDLRSDITSWIALRDDPSPRHEHTRPDGVAHHRAVGGPDREPDHKPVREPDQEPDQESDQESDQVAQQLADQQAHTHTDVVAQPDQHSHDDGATQPVVDPVRAGVANYADRSLARLRPDPSGLCWGNHSGALREHGGQ